MSGLSASDGGGRRPPSPTPRWERNKQQDDECSAPSFELPGFSARRDSSNVAGASVPWAFVMLEPYAGKLARTVLRERGDGDIALLPGTRSGHRLSHRRVRVLKDHSEGQRLWCTDKQWQLKKSMFSTQSGLEEWVPTEAL